MPLRVLLSRSGGVAALGADEARAASRFHGLADEDTVELGAGDAEAALRREVDAFLGPRF